MGKLGAGIAGEKKPTRSQSRVPSIAEIEIEINDRATYLQRSCSIAAFDLDFDEEEFEEAEDRVPPLRSNRVSVASLHAIERKFRNFSTGFNMLESLPSPANYADSSSGGKVRPTLEDLRREQELGAEDLVRNTGNEASSMKRGKLGWINGVVLWTLQDLWAVQLFLRLPWLAGQAGMGLYLVIVLASTLIALLTSLSTSAIATNGEIGIGGTYFMIARSLGPAYGAAIGVVFALANVINISLNLQGFADIVVGLMREHDQHMLNVVDDTRIVGVIALVLLTLFTFCGMVVASRLKSFLLVVVVAGILAVIIGSIIPPTLEQQAEGFVGYSNALFRENFAPAFQEDKFGKQSFLTAFAVFFPSISGILAGTSMTGDLRDPSGAIPKGTIVATLIASTVYLILGWVSGSVSLRHASGHVNDLLIGNLTDCHSDPYDAHTACHHGLINDMEIMGLIAHWRWIIVAATFAATVSTSLGCIHFAPKVFQALCRDHIFPYIHFFGKGYGHHDEPYRAYFLSMLIAIAFLMSPDINFISNVVCNCFLMTYAMVNYATFDASFSRSPGWRPTFKYYNMWLSLVTCIACLAFMFCVDYQSAIIVFVLAGVLWLYVFYKKPEVNWGTSGQANVYRTALKDALQLLKIQDHVKNYRPQILVLTGLPCVRPALVYMAGSITRATGLMICGHVMVGEPIMERAVLEQEVYRWFRRKKIQAFYEYISSSSTLEGTRALIQTSGLGKLKPNILMMGYHLNWTNWNAASMDEYVKVIHDTFDAHRGLIILCATEGFDLTEAVNFQEIVTQNEAEVLGLHSVDETEPEQEKDDAMEVNQVDDPVILARIALAQRLEPGKKKKLDGEIHVWWLFDDGGLTLLIPHLMTRQSPWNGCKLKIFCVIEMAGTAESTKTNILAMLTKFRIQAADVIPVDLEQHPSHASVTSFNQMINQYRYDTVAPGRANDPHKPSVIQESDLIDYGDKMMKQIRLRELLLEHSVHSSLNVVTMPLPRRNRSPTLYMAVLETMTSGMPPTLLVRGNQENVLTYYC
ncbi:Solute carrier family 12 member 2 [Hypsibius exemplaris]|uniref:Solute carrier family 12 member 3 n=1 Tax=Hypsibius exemplaris TaxID=2072580 RepID=A0A9X6ND39_HYPEX|nr:Solute carrier family 12 member 2 [Hypsibius exemplaris]